MAHLLAHPNHSILFSSINPRALARIEPPRRSLKTPSSALRNRLSVARAMASSSDDGAGSSKGSTNGMKNNIVSGPVQSGGAAGIHLPDIPMWAKLVLGSIFCIALPFYKRILRIEAAVEKDAETIVEVVEKVAEVTEKVASDVAAALPGNGRLKQELLKAVAVAEKVDKDAERAEAIIHKVDEIKEEIDTMVDPIIGELVLKGKESQAKKEDPIIGELVLKEKESQAKKEDPIIGELLLKEKESQSKKDTPATASTDSINAT